MATKLMVGVLFSDLTTFSVFLIRHWPEFDFILKITLSVLYVNHQIYFTLRLRKQMPKNSNLKEKIGLRGHIKNM